MDKIKKFLNKLKKNDRRKAEQALDDVLSRKLENYHVKKLRGMSNFYRIRIGRCRIIFYMDKTNTEIIDINNRDDQTYKNL